MREMVYRERMERVAHVRAFAGIAARLMGNVDLEKAFGDIIADYASEVFQESYDPDVLARKRDRLRAEQARVRKRRVEDMQALERLERMEKLGEEFDKKATSRPSRNRPK